MSTATDLKVEQLEQRIIALTQRVATLEQEKADLIKAVEYSVDGDPRRIPDVMPKSVSRGTNTDNLLRSAILPAQEVAQAVKNGTLSLKRR